jgi:8-oxo-dGTP pyrophosphatase MutT (NUDIX family)
VRWIVRVYGLLRDEKGRYLVLEEYFRGGWITKFPGGGVEPYEGLIDALHREMQEELGITVRRAEHFYTTDFFQRSYYHQEARLLSVYYRVFYEGEVRATSPWLRLFWLFPGLMRLTFPVDRYVQRLLMAEAPAE